VVSDVRTRRLLTKLELELSLYVGIGLERVGAGHAPSGHSETRRSATARCPTRFPVSVPSASPPFPRVFTSSDTRCSTQQTKRAKPRVRV
jgi:hypothetical protein